MELYIIIAFCAGLFSGSMLLYVGFKCGYSVKYKVIHDIPPNEDSDEQFEQDVTD